MWVCLVCVSYPRNVALDFVMTCVHIKQTGLVRQQQHPSESLSLSLSLSLFVCFFFFSFSCFLFNFMSIRHIIFMCRYRFLSLPLSHTHHAHNTIQHNTTHNQSQRVTVWSGWGFEGWICPRGQRTLGPLQVPRTSPTRTSLYPSSGCRAPSRSCGVRSHKYSPIVREYY